LIAIAVRARVECPEPTDKKRGQVEAMAIAGIPQVKIAEAIGISQPTLRALARRIMS
jgi:hypothetical protein